MYVEVSLTWYEVRLAAQVGVTRQLEALKGKRPDRHGFVGEGWNEHIEGAAGELAVAKALGVYWNGSINTYRDGGDVGSFQVRTRSKHYYDLIVRPNDNDQDVFVLVTGQVPSFRVHGWLLGSEAKAKPCKQTHGNRPEAWFVPAAELNPLDSLLKQEVG